MKRDDIKEEYNSGVLHNEFDMIPHALIEHAPLTNFIFNYLMCRGVEVFMVCAPVIMYEGNIYQMVSRKLKGKLLANKLEDLFSYTEGKKIGLYLTHQIDESIVVRFAIIDK